MNGPTFGSLFTGIGGFDLGLERAGWRCRWQVESDGFCRAVLARHWPDVRRYVDVADLPDADTDPVDLVVGGFPCQPVSHAGARRGVDDARWLWPEFARVVRVLRPGLVLVENVPNLLALNHGRAFGALLGDLAACGYDAEWDCLPASAFGANHERDRVFVVGCLADATGERLEKRHRVFTRGELAHAATAARAWWATEPGMARVAHGVSGRVDRIRALGNAVVPQVAEWLGRRLLVIVNEERNA